MPNNIAMKIMSCKWPTIRFYVNTSMCDVASKLQIYLLKLMIGRKNPQID